jgi:hypothetical protein
MAPRDRGPEVGMYCWMKHLGLPTLELTDGAFG